MPSDIGRSFYSFTILFLYLILTACGGSDNGPNIDTTAPDTSITSSPDVFSSLTQATFHFSATESNSTFEASIDNAPYTVVPNPFTINGLVEGAHKIKIRAVDVAGNKDESPATFIWTIDLTEPNTTITMQPAEVTNSTNATFEFASTDLNSSFEVSIDNGDYTFSSSQFDFAGLVNGTHTISVRAIDGAGNTDSTPASYSWVVDTIAPEFNIIFPSSISTTDANSIIIRGVASDANSISSVSVNSVNATTTDGFQNWQIELPLTEGVNDFSISVSDVANNIRSKSNSCTVISRGTVLQSAYTTRTSLSGSHTYVYDIDLNAMIVIDNITGNRSILSDAKTGSGSLLEGVYDFVIDEVNNRLISTDWITDRVMAISTETGNRTLLSGASASSDTKFTITAGITYDAANNRIFVVDRGDGSILAVNLTNGVRSVVSSTTVGTGTSFSNPLSIEYDNQTNTGSPRLLVTDSNVNAVIAVDIATGNRSLFSSASPYGSGTALGSPTRSYLDLMNNRLLVVDEDPAINQLVSIELSSGNRGNITSINDWNAWPFGYSFDAQANNLYVVSRTGANVFSLNLTSKITYPISNMSVGAGPRLSDARSASYDATTHSIFVPDATEDAIYRINLNSGNREIISSSTVGTGVLFNFPMRGELDTTTNPSSPRMLLVDSGLDALVSVDITSGNRTIISDAANGFGTNFQFPRDLTLDYANNDAYIVESYVVSNILKGFVYRVDLDTGDRTLVSSDVLGSGIGLFLSTSIIFDDDTTPGTPRLLVSDGQTFGIVGVDPDTGDRYMFSSNPPTGTGIAFLLPGKTLIDKNNNRLFVVDDSRNSIIAVDLENASRSLISGTNSNNTNVLGRGPLKLSFSGIGGDLTNNILYLAHRETILMVDIVTGERVIISW